MDILMPQLGETVAEGKITVWYKAVGDAVAAGDNLFEIETDKTSMEVPATAAGVLAEIRVAAGATVPVGSVVAVIKAQRVAPAPAAVVTGSASAPSGASKRPFDAFESVRTPEHNFGPAMRNGIAVTPWARRLAAETGVELTVVAGSGPFGRIVGQDVRTAARQGAAAQIPVLKAAAAPAASEVKALFADVTFVEIALDGMRRTIALRLAEAKQRIPHFYLTIDVALGQLLALRGEINAKSGDGLKLSISDFVIKAMALGLQQVPDANAVWAHECILRFEHSDVAVAVAVPGGLLTPVIRNAEAKSLRTVSGELKALAERARGKGLQPIDYRGGSITISNLGMYGVRAFSAIINPPQSAILAVGAAERRAVEAADGSVRFESLMTVTLSCDHRVIDGVLGAQLLSAFKMAMEAPAQLLA
jgi:pyruvate dehydrogenase E2 component (dihydrolipoamide acetyltransferase)